MSDPMPLRELVHEMRNALAIARANLEGLVDGKLAPTPERLLGIIQALSQLQALVDDVGSRETAVGMALKPSVINVCELLDREYRAMEPVARARDVAVSINQCSVPAQECLHFYGDAARIGQIMKNVLINAIRYTPRGGSISVDCTRRADQLEVRIADTGPGIDAADRDRIFDAGFRGAATANTSGSGYGLAVVKQLVEEQGGGIETSAATPHGAVFTVRLPGKVPAGADVCAGCKIAQVRD
jgi:signal transduction histidine kinase